jgi:hypothetical protein
MPRGARLLVLYKQDRVGVTRRNILINKESSPMLKYILTALFALSLLLPLMTPLANACDPVQDVTDYMLNNSRLERYRVGYDLEDPVNPFEDQWAHGTEYNWSVEDAPLIPYIDWERVNKADLPFSD